MDYQNAETRGDDGIVSSRRSIAERRAAKCGFRAERISDARWPAGGSPCLTIPSGISPTELLESPVMLHNSHPQPSPTTGTFPLPPLNHENAMQHTLNSADEDKNSDAECFLRLKPHLVLDSLPDTSTFENQVLSPSNPAQKADVDYQEFFTSNLPIDFEFSAELPKENSGKTCTMDPVDRVKVSSSIIVNDICGNVQIDCSDRDGNLTSVNKESVHGEDVGAHSLLEGDQKGTNPQMEMVRTSEDEYNWRKYGQKQVKGSEYPRSYYKCTHLNCQVKKKVERSFDGQITKIIYKGVHNHPKPQPSRRPLLGSAFSVDEMSETSEGRGSCLKVEGGLVWRNSPAGLKDVKLALDGHADGPEKTSSSSIITELSDPLSTTHGNSIGAFESSEMAKLSSTLASHDDNEDGAKQGSILLGDDVDDDDESQSKRRKTESILLESNLASRAVREPRVVVQIETEVDILDDGYRWRKYGQKVVKGNPNPRSYYKCTSAGCSVRKHVERASHNLKFVITTYEGKHNHEVPAARNSSHVNSTGVSLLTPAAEGPSPLNLPRNSYTSKPEPQIQDIPPHFDRKPEFNGEYLGPGFLGNLNNEVKFGVPSLYLMKFPPLQNPYGSFEWNANRNVTSQSGSIDPIIHDFPISFPWSLASSANLSLAGFDFNNNNGNSSGQVQSNLSGQHLENDIRFRPKQEQKDDNLFDTCFHIL